MHVLVCWCLGKLGNAPPIQMWGKPPFLALVPPTTLASRSAERYDSGWRGGGIRGIGTSRGIPWLVMVLRASSFDIWGGRRVIARVIARVRDGLGDGDARTCGWVVIGRVFFCKHEYLWFCFNCIEILWFSIPRIRGFKCIAFSSFNIQFYRFLDFPVSIL